MDRYQFTHVLVRETLYDELSGARRVRLHRSIGEAMEEIYRANLNPYLAQLAYHFCEASRAGVADKAIDYATRAADRDLALLAYEEAIRHYEMARQAQTMAGPADEARDGQLLLSLGEAHKKAGDFHQAMESFQRAAAVARKLGMTEALVRAAIGFEDASWRPGNFGQPAAELLQEALGRFGEGDLRLKARATAALVRALYYSGLQREASALSQQAVVAARRSGDPETLAHVLSLTMHANPGPDYIQSRLTGSTELMELASRANNTDALLDIYSWYLPDLLEIGDRPTFYQLLGSFQQHAERLRQPFYLYVVESMKASLAIAQGQFQEAERLAREALQIGQRLKGQDPSGIFGMKMFTIYKEQGRLEEVAPAMAVFLQQYTADSAWRPGLALIYRELGREAEARAEFENLAADDFASLPRDALLVVCLAYLSEVCVFLEDVARAETLYRRLLPWQGHNVVVPGGAAYYGSASRYLGLLATARSRWEEAEEHFRVALEMDAALGARTWLAHTQHDFARMLLARNRPQDHEPALALLEEAGSAAARLGMRALAQRVRELQDRAVSPPGREPEYPDGLTQREVEVLRLVATGKTNREIAGDLFISVGTVNTHVKNLLNKTSCANRTEATAYAARQGLV